MWSNFLSSGSKGMLALPSSAFLAHWRLHLDHSGPDVLREGGALEAGLEGEEGLALREDHHDALQTLEQVRSVLVREQLQPQV